MQVKWSNKSNNDILEFISYAKVNSLNTYSSYMHNLVGTVYDLQNSPRMGRFLFYAYKNSKKLEIRQLIYKKHRIIYYISDNIYIVTILHEKMDFNSFAKNINKYL